MELQKLLNKIEGTPEEALISRLTLMQYEAGKMAVLSARTFRAGKPVLLSLYLSHTALSRFADPPHNQGTAPRAACGKQNNHYEQILPGGKTVQPDGTTGG